MSKPRLMEQRRRRRRKRKLSHLKLTYTSATSDQERQAIVDKAVKVAPTVARESFVKLKKG